MRPVVTTPRGEEMQNMISPCDYARERHHNIARWRNLWSILVFAFGSAVVLFLILAIFLFINKSWIPGAVSSLGTMANGLAMSWVTARRNDAVKEEQDAYNDVIVQFGGPNSPI